MTPMHQRAHSGATPHKSNPLLPITNPQALVLYELDVTSLTLGLGGGREFDATATLSNGRSSYVLFEALARHLYGLTSTTGSDHVDAAGQKYEQKSFVDALLAPLADALHTAPSSTFGANNHGKVLGALVRSGDYQKALAMCTNLGYSKNHFYLYTNTGKFKPAVTPLRFIVVPTSLVLKNLDLTDPRLISRKAVLALATHTVQL